MYDVVIVGARCAGSPLAMLLARAGHKVLLLDRAKFPADTPSTHFINSPGVLRLAKWGLLDRLFETNCPPITKFAFDIAGEETVIDIPPLPGIPGMVCPRRIVLDKLLADAAVEAGAEFLDGVMVESLIEEEGRVVGIKGRGPDGDFDARARYVIGADGRHSTVAEKVGAGFRRHVDTLTTGYYSYFANTGITDTTMGIYRDDVMSVIFPTNDGNVCAAIIWDQPVQSEMKKDIEGNFNRSMASLGPRGQVILDAERVERFYGVHDLPNYSRKMTGPGWALVGDAAYNKDPIPADGITDAFRGADMLAVALDSALTGGDEAAAMKGYEAGYEETISKRFDAAVRSATFGLSPQERADAFYVCRLADFEETSELLGA
jgi:flavin-dependent dehydrogenase